MYRKILFNRLIIYLAVPARNINRFSRIFFIEYAINNTEQTYISARYCVQSSTHLCFDQYVDGDIFYVYVYVYIHIYI